MHEIYQPNSWLQVGCDVLRMIAEYAADTWVARGKLMLVCRQFYHSVGTAPIWFNVYVGAQAPVMMQLIRHMTIIGPQNGYVLNNLSHLTELYHLKVICNASGRMPVLHNLRTLILEGALTDIHINSLPKIEYLSIGGGAISIDDGAIDNVRELHLGKCVEAGICLDRLPNLRRFGCGSQITQNIEHIKDVELYGLAVASLPNIKPQRLCIRNTSITHPIPLSVIDLVLDSSYMPVLQGYGNIKTLRIRNHIALMKLRDLANLNRLDCQSSLIKISKGIPNIRQISLTEVYQCKLGVHKNLETLEITDCVCGAVILRSLFPSLQQVIIKMKNHNTRGWYSYDTNFMKLESAGNDDSGRAVYVLKRLPAGRDKKQSLVHLPYVPEA